MAMTSQPRHLAGTRTAGVSTGGRYTHKTVPDVKEDDIWFTNVDAVGPPNDWHERTVNVWGLKTTFTRTIETGETGDTVVSVTADCDEPSVMLLAKKGDVDYWSDAGRPIGKAQWTTNNKDRRMWCSEITRQMLQDGHVATAGYNDRTDVAGIRPAMRSAGSPTKRREPEQHTLTAAVAQIRGLRLIESMVPAGKGNTMLGGHLIPAQIDSLLSKQFDNVAALYRRLPQPPWVEGSEWGPQTVAGHAATNYVSVFVGERGDLLWRALTETSLDGRSPLTVALDDSFPPYPSDLFAAAALYDETAEYQLTHGLFVGAANKHRLRDRALVALKEALNPPAGECRWTVEQQHRLRGFVAVVEGLQP